MISVDHKDADEILKYRSQRFRRLFDPDRYINPYVNPRYKFLFKMFESIVEYADFRVDTRENGDPIIIIEPIDREKYMEKYKKTDIIPEYGLENLIDQINFVYDRGVEKMKEVVKDVKKQNMTHSELVPLPYLRCDDESEIH